MGRRGYPPEFRTEAVRLARSAGHTYDGVAHDLGITRKSIRRWARQLDIDEGVEDGLTTDERDELARLRRENRTLRLEREILKKAAVFFAMETDETR